MGHSIRSKKKRAFRALKREKYALKERACLEKLVEEGTLRKYVEEFKNSREEAIEEVEDNQTQASQSEISGGLQEMKDLTDAKSKRNWESRNQMKKKKKKAASLKMKNKKSGKGYKFSSGTMSKSSW